MFSKHRAPGVVALLCLSILGSLYLQAQTVTVYPAEYPDALANPLMGFRDGFETSKLSSWKTKPYQSLYRHYIHWNLIENVQSDGVQKIKDYCNTMWAGCEAANVKIIPRVILQYGDGQYYFPSYLPTPSATNLAPWKSQALRTAVTNMIAKLGQAWDNDPRVAWVQTGIIGKWGEQESDVGVNENVVAPDNANWATIMGPAFVAAFPNKIQIVRNQNGWTQPMGVYWDSFAHTGQYSGAWATIKSYNAASRFRYLTAPVEGEIAYNWGTGRTNFGFTPNETCTTPAYYDFVINTIKQLHCSGLGWVSGYTPGPATATGANLIQKAFGYRFHITEFQCSARTEPGSTLTMSAKVKNIGSAVIHANYPVAFVLVDESTRQIVHQSVISGTDIRTWKPGSNYDWDPNSNPNGSKVYLTPAVENSINASIPIPANLTPGQYLAGIAILEPSTQKPGVFFAVPNFFKQSQSQPLCRIGIGADASNNTLTGPFDSLLNDDARYYSTNSVGPTYALTLQPSSQGTISANPGGASYAKDTAVQVTATGNLGYAFSSWGGALAGSTDNPVIIVMNTNKSISANYVPVPTYTLTTNAVNGSITLNPPGGIYSSGTVVTVTATPNNGYQFDSWSGAVSGSANPTNITMSGNKSVTANFAVFHGEGVPWTETFTMADGTKTDGPPTSWTAPRSTGLFQVSGNRLIINGAGDEGLFETAEVGIAGGSVRISLEVQAAGPMETTDYVRFYKIVDGGPPMLISQEILGGFTGTKVLTETNITGGMLKLRIATRVSAGDEYFYFDNLAVENVVPLPTYTLTASAANGSITLDPPGGVYATGTVVTVTASPGSGFAFTNWSGDLTGSVNPTNITMNGNKSVMANFAVSSGLTSFRVNCGGSAYDAGGGIVFEADGIYNFGGNTFSTALPIAGTTNDPLYQTERWGNSFSYGVPMVNGDYEVTLMFAEINFSAAGSRVFNVAIEGTQVITNLDIWARVGKDAAYNVTNRVTVSDGQLNIAFSPVIENPKISAIQVRRIVGPDPYFQPPVLQGGQLRLEWVGGGTLQTTTNLLGTWSDIPGAVSPHLNPTTHAAQFFRVKQ